MMITISKIDNNDNRVPQASLYGNCERLKQDNVNKSDLNKPTIPNILSTDKDWGHTILTLVNDKNNEGKKKKKKSNKNDIKLFRIMGFRDRGYNYREVECLWNRTRWTSLLPNIIKMEFVSGSFLSTKVLIPIISLIPTDSGLPFSFKRRQFPERPAFVMTINKAQGQTLNKLYVAMSRVCSPHKLKIITYDKTRTTTNVVYREVISD
ncbi:uncharacterized protein LOC135926926 [Gordionus sp. m RMFG-2023]|uniref:uncharacterized protein LOC135926926 n=1 Tax=Gordionus sp. m RMFG-2023 TaxID=3053472 RepID=UPI0031FE0D8E